MSYTPLKFHQRASSPGPSWTAPSQGGSRGLTVYGVPDPRGAGASLPGNTPWQKAPGRKPFSPRVITGDRATARLREAVEKAFPHGKNTPRWREIVPRAASAAWGRASVLDESASIAATVHDAYGDIQWSLLFPWANRAQETVINPGLTQLGNWRHSSYVGTPGIWEFPGPDVGHYITATDYRSVAQNTWLRNGRPVSAENYPSGLLGRTDTGPIPDGYYWYFPVEPFHKTAQNSFTRFWYAWTNVFRNNTGQAQPRYVTNTFDVPVLPYGPTLPQGMPQGFPLVPDPIPMVKPLTRPRRYDEVAVNIRPWRRTSNERRWGLAVYPTRPRGPGKYGKETKSWGKASSAASFAFWAYENTQDWADWVGIVVAAIPDAPNWVKGAVPTAQIKWLYENPAAIATADWSAAAMGFAQWAIDEAFGAFVGEVNKRANRGISTGGFTIDMRTNVSQHYSAAGPSPGAFAVEFARAFF